MKSRARVYSVVCTVVALALLATMDVLLKSGEDFLVMHEVYFCVLGATFGISLAAYALWNRNQRRRREEAAAYLKQAEVWDNSRYRELCVGGIAGVRSFLNGLDFVQQFLVVSFLILFQLVAAFYCYKVLLLGVRSLPGRVETIRVNAVELKENLFPSRGQCRRQADFVVGTEYMHAVCLSDTVFRDLSGEGLQSVTAKKTIAGYVLLGKPNKAIEFAPGGRPTREGNATSLAAHR